MLTRGKVEVDIDVITKLTGYYRACGAVESNNHITTLSYKYIDFTPKYETP